MTQPRGPVWLDLVLRVRDDLAAVLPDVVVEFGRPTQMSSGDYVGVGMTDPESTRGPTSAAQYDIEWAAADVDFGFSETGTFTLAAWCWVGGSDLESAGRRMERIQNALIGLIRPRAYINAINADLGVFDLHLESGEIETQTDTDAQVYGLFRVTYAAHI